jgi:hypothetical protein
VDEQVKRLAEQADVLIVPGKKSNNTAAFTGIPNICIFDSHEYCKHTERGIPLQQLQPQQSYSIHC